MKRSGFNFTRQVTLSDCGPTAIYNALAYKDTTVSNYKKNFYKLFREMMGCDKHGTAIPDILRMLSYAGFTCRHRKSRVTLQDIDNHLYRHPLVLCYEIPRVDAHCVLIVEKKGKQYRTINNCKYGDFIKIKDTKTLRKYMHKELWVTLGTLKKYLKHDYNVVYLK